MRSRYSHPSQAVLPLHRPAEQGAVFVELVLALPIFFTVFFYFLLFGVGVSSLGIVARDAYVFSLLSEANQEKSIKTSKISLERFIVGHPDPTQQGEVIQVMKRTRPFNLDSNVDLNFFNYVAGEAVRRSDAVGFTDKTKYLATSILVEADDQTGRALEKRTVQRRVHLFGYHLTLEGAFFGPL